MSRQGLQKIHLPSDTKAIRDICILPGGHVVFASLGKKLSLLRSILNMFKLFFSQHIYSEVWFLFLCFISQHDNWKCRPSLWSTGDSLTLQFHNIRNYFFVTYLLIRKCSPKVIHSQFFVANSISHFISWKHILDIIYAFSSPGGAILVVMS